MVQSSGDSTSGSDAKRSASDSPTAPSHSLDESEQTIISEEFSAVQKASSKPDPIGVVPVTHAKQSQFSTPNSEAEPCRFHEGFIFANRYRIASMLGKGGMGEVYLAEDLVLDQSVALKFLPEASTFNETAIQRIRHEVRLARRVTHINVCRVHDIGEFEGIHYLSMEYVEGEDLSCRLRNEGRLPRERAFGFCRQISGGLAAAHARGVLHRDLKPGNILIDRQERVTITDFGLAVTVEKETTHRSMVGTLPYMSPEQVAGGVLTEKSDLFSLGLLIHDIFTGKRVFKASTPAELIKMRRIEGAALERLSPELDAAVRPIVEKCLAQNPEDRPSSAAEVLLLLQRAESPSDDSESSNGAAIPNNLPTQLTTFIGRDYERNELRQLIFQTRMLTLLGPGGAGKSRLSLQVAEDELQKFPKGVWFVELAPIVDPALVPQTIASVVGVREAGGRPVLETLAESIGKGHVLLVLDNCEHLIGASASAAELLLKRCPNLRIIASSRERLGIPGENSWPIPSLSLPSVNQSPTAASALEFEAVALFVDRAQSASGKFRLTDSNASIVAQVCRRLDGIPLAIELAAARTKVLSVEELDRRLDDRFRVLTGGSKSLLPRQQTLRALIDWSYDLLNDSERALLLRLSVFTGGFTLTAVEKVCAGDPVDDYDVIDVLTSLVEKSLVFADTSREETRYSLLESVKHYAAEKLKNAGDFVAFQTRHIEFFLDFCAKAAQGIQGDQSVHWSQLFDSEHDNIRCAFDNAVTSPETCEHALKLANEAATISYRRGLFRELADRMSTALAKTEHLGKSPNRATGLLSYGYAVLAMGEYQKARDLFREVIEMRGNSGDKLGIWVGLFNLGNALNLAGELAEARAVLEDAYQKTSELPRAVAASRMNLGECLALSGEWREARGHLTFARDAFRKVGNAGAVAEISEFLGWISQKESKFDEAEIHYRHSLELLRRNQFVGYGFFVGPYSMASLALSRGEFELSARLFAAHEAQRERLGTPLPPVMRREYEEHLSQLETALGREKLLAEMTTGRRYSDTRALGEALQEIDQDTISSTRTHDSQDR